LFNESHTQNPAIAFFSISIMGQKKQQAASANMTNLGFSLGSQRWYNAHAARAHTHKHTQTQTHAHAQLLQRCQHTQLRTLLIVAISIYHAHTQFTDPSDPNPPRKREHDPTYLDQQHHAEADCVLALDVSLRQKDLGATTKHMPALLIALLVTIAATETEIDLHFNRRAKCLSAASAVVDTNHSAIYLTFLRRFG
jgi:hypothetical protein